MIKNYLYQVETWGDHELELFENTLFSLSPEDVQIIYTTVLKNIQAIDRHDDLSNHKFTNLMFNLVAYSIDRNGLRMRPPILNRLAKLSRPMIYTPLS
jgi:Rgg/GadR/MutR family transcriptional activator